MKKLMCMAIVGIAMMMASCVPSMKEITVDVVNETDRSICVATGNMSGSTFAALDETACGPGCSISHAMLDVPKKKPMIAFLVCKSGYSVMNPSPEEAWSNRDENLSKIAELKNIHEEGHYLITIRKDGEHTMVEL